MMKNLLLTAASILVMTVGSAFAMTIPERLIQDLSEDFGLADFQAAGIAGGLARETGNFRFLLQKGARAGSAKSGIGYAQWQGQRRKNFEAWAGEGADLLSYEVNYGFLARELRTSYADVLKEIRQTDSTADATQVFMLEYLRPSRKGAHYKDRLAYAKAYLEEDYSGAGCAALHRLEIENGRPAIQTCADILWQIGRIVPAQDAVANEQDPVDLASLRPEPRRVAVPREAKADPAATEAPDATAREAKVDPAAKETRRAPGPEATSMRPQPRPERTFKVAGGRPATVPRHLGLFMP